MKRTCIRLIAGLITVCMMLAAFAAVLPVTAFAATVTDGNAFGAGIHSFIAISGSGMGQRIKVNAPFTGITFDVYAEMHTNNTGYVSVYSWAGDYETTIASEPLVRQYFDPFADGNNN